MEILFPWERLLWSGRPTLARYARERYVLTDLRLVRLAGARLDEILLRDIGEIHRTQSRLDRILGVSTVAVHPRDWRRPPVVLRHVRRGQSLAALIEWMSGDSGRPASGLDAAAVKTAMAWSPKDRPRRYAEALVSLTAALGLIFGIAIGLHGKSQPPARYAPDDAIYPDGRRRSEAEIVRFMEDEVMPWARATLGPLKGGGGRITCATCHGSNAAPRGWLMPAVAALPQPDVREAGWERYGGPMDAQMRNAIYGYVAQSDKQTKAAYMREVVMPGMAKLLHRPTYDFTRPYEYNRSRLAFGCYHCHRVI